MVDVNFTNLLSAASLLESLKRPTSASVLRQAASEKLSATFNQYSDGHSAKFNELPNSLSKRDLFFALTSLADNLPKSNGAAISQIIPKTVGIITDVYMYNFYKDVFSTVVYLNPDNYNKAFQENRFDAIIYVSCWKGISDEEWRGIKYREKPAKAFAGILELAKRQGAVTIFQSIEDPSNFENFLPLARQCDFVFTSDSDSIERYKAELGHDAVFYGEYGVNPLLHNPVGCRTHVLNAAFFAGSWASRYQERCDDMRTIFSSVRDCGAPLIIVDRNYGSDAKELQYPSEFIDSVLPSVDHEQLQALHKIFRYSINLNSIKGSATMCAMRVYELQAMGVGMMSNYARSVFNNFPEIRIVPYPGDLSFDFQEQEGFGEYLNNMRRLRNVMTGRTAYDVTARMFACAGITSSTPNLPKVAIIIDPEHRDSLAQAEQQSYDFCSVVSPENADHGLVEGFDYFTWFDPDCTYGPYYIQDMINALKYTNSSFITKHAWFSPSGYVGGPQHQFTQLVAGKARSLLSTACFDPNQFMELGYHEPLCVRETGYALDPFELFSNLGSENPLSRAIPRYRLSVIVPVFNNGRFLVAKCIESLKRNKLWKQIEVVLVDDGSTDERTIEAVESLVADNDNILAHFFADGGSGTASRARNTGVEMASAPLISFLDPDNEISPGGYDNLVEIFDEVSAENDIDFVSGYHVKVEETTKVIGKHSSDRIRIVANLKEAFLQNGKFPVIATQPAVIKKELLVSRSLQFVEGAAGQDTLFGWELLCYARSGVFTDAANLIYYAQRDGSIVNDIDRCYFKKKLVLEKAQVDFLKREGLMETYVKKTYQRYMDGWYMPKLSSVFDLAEKEACRDILCEIEALYGMDRVISGD